MFNQMQSGGGMMGKVFGSSAKLLPDPYNGPAMGANTGMFNSGSSGLMSKPTYQNWLNSPGGRAAYPQQGGGMQQPQQPRMGTGQYFGPGGPPKINMPGQPMPGMGGGMGRQVMPGQPPSWGAGGIGGGMGGNGGFNPGAGNQDFLKQLINPSGGMGYLGGSQTFDESTGQYRQPGQQMDRLRQQYPNTGMMG